MSSVSERSTAVEAEAVIARWHEVVNAADLVAARLLVTDPIVVFGPKGRGPITPDGFAEWITRSGITLRARSYHPIDARVFAVEQTARWPMDRTTHRVVTVFRVTDTQVSAALRFPRLHDALEFAYLYHELAVTERPQDRHALRQKTGPNTPLEIQVRGRADRSGW